MEAHENSNENIAQQLEKHYKDILNLLVNEAHKEGLEQTPLRVAQTMIELTRGYNQDAVAELQRGAFAEEHQKMIVVQNIPFFSMCEHHLVPFFGKVHIAYIPNKEITGFSKFAKVVDIYSHRFQVQERLTHQIMECIQQALNPLGVMVYITAEHMCMQMRGDETQGAIVSTTDYCGAFNDALLRNEFINMITQTTPSK